MDQEAPERISNLKYPKVFESELSSLMDFFPDFVEFDNEDKSISFKKPLTRKERIATSYLRFISGVDDIVGNLNIVVADLDDLGRTTPLSPLDAERRYTLLTKVFFYELLRIRDDIGRFLKRLETDGIVTKDQRRKGRKLLEEQFQEHYLFRNVFLHGHSIPRSEEEHDLLLMSMFYKAGYEPELRPKDSGPVRTYPETFQKLAVSRADAFREIGKDAMHFLQSVVNVTSTWIYENEFKGPEPEKAEPEMKPTRTSKHS